MCENEDSQVYVEPSIVRRKMKDISAINYMLFWLQSFILQDKAGTLSFCCVVLWIVLCILNKNSSLQYSVLALMQAPRSVFKDLSCK